MKVADLDGEVAPGAAEPRDRLYDVVVKDLDGSVIEVSDVNWDHDNQRFVIEVDIPFKKLAEG